jgi:hypothetical protein
MTHQGGAYVDSALDLFYPLPAYVRASLKATRVSAAVAADVNSLLLPPLAHILIEKFPPFARTCVYCEHTSFSRRSIAPSKNQDGFSAMRPRLFSFFLFHLAAYPVLLYFSIVWLLSRKERRPMIFAALIFELLNIFRGSIGD